jgi:3-methyladenine DNA glycosylase AlkD
MTAAAAKKELRKLADPVRAKEYLWFFKTGKGEYGEGDKFIGVTMPQIRAVAKTCLSLSLQEIEMLLRSRYHENRMLALVVLTEQYNTCAKNENEQITKYSVLRDRTKVSTSVIYAFYLQHTDRINNWDLVDVSVHKIVGAHVLNRDRKVLYTLAQSTNLWERRMAIVATAMFIHHNDLDDTFALSELLLYDTHDLMHKAVGWMLREAGKKDAKRLSAFLQTHAVQMPRTMLRYAIEKYPERERKKWLAMGR